MEEIKQKRPGLKDYSRINYRLVQEWQVPNWVKVQPISQDEENAKLVTLGKRERKQAFNYDNLTEMQFLKIIDEGNDPVEVMKKAAKRRNQRIRTDDKGGANQIQLNEFDDEDLYDDVKEQGKDQEIQGITQQPKI